ncbi:TetR family transcriptional regulator [Alkalicoccus daliensis]|uniref:Transcriptional regulator, TetR family n=1 Tax=Alkalicoccus daliensis TaxID=745820 RepID=A0A1H0JNP4_9BACI|nr:TetR family transcriptional regulator [Alkalicoccus daliensis]SDO45089.1 transcriptional regulator, TetR family [Alkalicoccus daliensis]
MREEKQRKIVDAAMEVIEEHGFEKASVSQFVKRAGVAQGTFYLYFSSKNEIVPAIAERILTEQLKRVQERAGESPSRKELLHALIDITFDITEEYKSLISFCYAGIALYYSFERWEEIYRPYYSWLEEQFEHLRSDKKIAGNVALAYQVNYTVGLIEHGAESYYLSHTAAGDRKEMKKQLYKFTKQALYA